MKKAQICIALIKSEGRQLHCENFNTETGKCSKYETCDILCLDTEDAAIV